MRGQFAAQIFIYILGIIVVGVILLVGIRAIGALNAKQCDAQRAQFSTELASMIEKYKKNGVGMTDSIQLPCDATEVCFVSRNVVDMYPTEDAGANGEMKAAISGVSPAIASFVIDDNIPTNVYLQVDGAYEEVTRFSTPAPIALPASEPIRCFSGDPVRIRFKGQGQFVEVAQVGVIP